MFFKVKQSSVKSALVFFFFFWDTSTSQTKGIKILIRHVKWYSNDISCTKMCVWFVTNLLKQNCPSFYLINAMYILSISPKLHDSKFFWLVKKNVAYFTCRKGKPCFWFLCGCCLSQWSGCAVSIPIFSEDELKLGRFLVRETTLGTHKIWPIF